LSDIHLTQELLLAAVRGDVHPDFVFQIAEQHLSRLCPSCRDEIEAFRRRMRRGKAGEYGVAALVPSLLERLGPPLEADERRGRRDLEALLSLDPEAQVRTVKRSRSRFRSSALVRLLIAESGRRVQADPGEAHRLAALALEVLNTAPGRPGYYTLLVLALATMANARRAAGQFREADGAFENVRNVIRTWGVTDPEVIARVDELEGSLRKDLRRFAEAEELLIRAELFYQLAGDEEGLVRVLLTLGITYNLQGKLHDAIEVTRTALRRMSPNANPRLYLCSRYNLAYYLLAVGQIDECAELLDEDEEQYQRFPDSWTQLRVTWLRGDIGQIRGDEETAEKSYRKAFEGFLKMGFGYDAALVALDLALLYLRQGRTSEVKRLARQMIPIFQAQDVHREALAALALFQKAARREEVTVEQLLRLVKYLQEARNDPGMGWEGEGEGSLR
jgi:tetratricopeptide (TPR) repeat protein